MNRRTTLTEIVVAFLLVLGAIALTDRLGWRQTGESWSAW